jgi:hypothetical protein
MLNDEKLVKTPALYEFIFNLLLVKHNARRAYLFETSNFLTENVGDQEHMSYMSSFLRRISSIGLFYQLTFIKLYNIFFVRIIFQTNFLYNFR